MASAGTLVVNLGLNATTFRAGLSTAQKALGSFRSATGKVVGALTSFKSVLTGVAAAAGAGIAFGKLIDNINKLDKVAKTAARTGLSGEFLQRLEFAADQSGVSAEGLTNAIQKMTIAVGNGAKGFDTFGVTLKELQGLSPEEQFLRVAQAIAKLPTPAERAAAAMKAFGRGGIEMIPLLNNGMGGIVELMKEAKRLGIGLSDEALRKIEAANDAWGAMKAAVGALWDQVTVALAPALTDVANKIKELIPPTTELLNKWQDMPNKWQFLGDVIAAVFDLAIAKVEAKWNEAFARMTADARAVMDWAAFIANPQKNALETGMQVAAEAAGQQPNAIESAQSRLANLMRQLNAAGIRAVAENTPKPKPNGGAGLAGLAGLWGDTAGIRGGIEQGLKGILDRTMIRGNAFVGMLEGWLGSGRYAEEELKPPEPVQFAAAMQRGSVEAYSTIIQAMTRAKDPNVKATEKQTKEIVGAIKESKPIFAFVEDFFG